MRKRYKNFGDTIIKNFLNNGFDNKGFYKKLNQFVKQTRSDCDYQEYIDSMENIKRLRPDLFKIEKIEEQDVVVCIEVVAYSDITDDKLITYEKIFWLMDSFTPPINLKVLKLSLDGLSECDLFLSSMYAVCEQEGKELQGLSEHLTPKFMETR